MFKYCHDLKKIFFIRNLYIHTEFFSTVSHFQEFEYSSKVPF